MKCKTNNPPKGGLFVFDWVVCLRGEDDAASATSLELNPRTEVRDECLLEIRRLHLELTREVLDGDAFTTLCARNDVGEVDVGIRRRERSGSHCDPSLSCFGTA